MRKLRIYFDDFWPGLNMHDNFITQRLIANNYDFEIDPNPDYLFCSSFGCSHLKYRDCVKIYFTGENNVPDFNLYDYAMSFHPISFGDRHLRFPLYLLYKGYNSLSQKVFDKEKILNRKFCNFVYSNAKWADPFRDKFFHELSKYKRIDSGGKHLNNIGFSVPDKLNFIKAYKFTIAFENSSLPGYTTEKVMEPMVVNSIPIYWGNPDVGSDFNERSFIIVNKKFQEEAIAEIIRLDQDDDAYLNMLSEPWLKGGRDLESQLLILDSFLKYIFELSVEEAKRCSDYGYVQRYKQTHIDLNKLKKILFWKKI